MNRMFSYVENQPVVTTCHNDFLLQLVLHIHVVGIILLICISSLYYYKAKISVSVEQRHTMTFFALTDIFQSWQLIHLHLH